MKQKAEDSLGMLVQVVPASSGANAGWSLGALSLEEEHRD